MSKEYSDVWFLLGEHAPKPKFENVKKETAYGTSCGEKIIKFASKNSVKLDEKSTSDF